MALVSITLHSVFNKVRHQEVLRQVLVIFLISKIYLDSKFYLSGIRIVIIFYNFLSELLLVVESDHVCG